ncbi:MAG: hypothetical protein FWG66_12380 [Spirochaetes bacterium]|nr:hypothetical protein [Spirochaetota bacterium]
MHLLEACNYRCRHCFAYFDSDKQLSVQDSYIIIDSNGKLLDNSIDGHKIVADLTQEDFSTAFKRMPFNKKLYNARYK